MKPPDVTSHPPDRADRSGTLALDVFCQDCGMTDFDIDARTDPGHTPWYLEGNFGPVFDEVTDVNLRVTGSIPPSGPLPAHWIQSALGSVEPLVRR